MEQCRSGICVALKQRNDLIPNLVASLKAYMGHENEILTRIAELRSRADGAPEAEQIKDGTEISALLKLPPPLFSFASFCLKDRNFFSTLC